MNFFRNLSIRLKQTLIIMLTSSIALLLACAAFIAYDAVTFRTELVEKETSVATGTRSIAGLNDIFRYSSELIVNRLSVAMPNV